MATAARVDAQVTSYAYVVLPSPGSVVVIDTRTRTIVGAPIAIGTSSYSAVPTPDGRRVYVAGFGNNSVKVLDAVTNAFIGLPITVGNNPYGIGLTPDGSKLYVPNSGGATMTVIDTVTNTVITTVATGVSPATPGFSPDGQRVYVPNFGSNTLSVFNTATNAPIVGSPFGLTGCSNPLYATFTHDGQRAYISCYSSANLQVIDTATVGIVGTVAGLTGARDSVLTRDGSRLLVGNLESGPANVFVVNVPADTLAPNLTLTNSPASIGITPDGTAAYVTEYGATDKVTVLDVATLAVIDTIPMTSDVQAHSRFMGPNVITTTCAGLGAIEFHDDAEGRRAAWASVGVMCDELSTPVLVFSLPAAGETPLGRLLRAAQSDAEPFHVSLRLLLRHPLRNDTALAQRDVFVCENPTIVALAAARIGPGCAPLVCVNGQFATPSLVLLRQLREAGAQLHYHGDFDPAGLMIANRVMAEGEARPWRFGTADYLAAPKGIAFAGEPGPTPWDPALSDAMQVDRRTVHEEAVFAKLAEDLARGHDERR